MFSKEGTIDLKQSEMWVLQFSFYLIIHIFIGRLVDGLKESLLASFKDTVMSEKDLAAVLSKFDDLKTFVHGNLVSSNMKSLKIASLKFLKSLLGAVKEIKEEYDENSGKR